jgi:hypothetical protein
VILRGGERNDVAAIRDREERRFFSDHELLDDDGLAGGAERAPLHAIGDGGVGIGERLAHDGALPGSQPVGLHDERCAELAAESPGGDRVGERLEARGRHPMTRHQRLRKRLRAFDGRGAAPGAEDREAARAEAIGEACDQRRFRTDHGEIHVLAHGERDQSVEVVDADVDGCRVPRDAGIPRRGPQTLHQRALRELPRERVFAAAAADEQDLHSRLLPSGGSTSSRCARAMRAHGLDESSSR